MENRLGSDHQIIAGDHHDRGITIIELLVAIAVLGILAAIALPAYLAQADRARVAAVLTIADAIAGEILEQALLEGYPPDRLHNQAPRGIRLCNQDEVPDGCWVDRARLPWRSPLDYDNHGLGSGWCLAQITFFGRNGERDSSPLSAVPQGDDRIVAIGLYRCDEPVGAVR